jgi:hypothetical protein
VSRVIYIGTPHRGSNWARRLVGRLGSAQVREPLERELLRQELLRDNPGVFAPTVARRFPTSIDLLEPAEPGLRVIESLPYRAGVYRHSIIGDYRWMIGSGPSDGVVPIASAREPNVNSERIITARHVELHRDPETVAEVVRILRQHAAAAPACQTLVPVAGR